MKTRKHNQIRTKLFLYAEGSLSDEEKLILTEHLDSCADCRLYLEELKQTLVIWERNKDFQPNPYFYAGVKNRITTRQKLVFYPVWRRLQPAFFVVLLLLGIRMGIWVGEQARSESQSSETIAFVPFDDLAEEPIEDFLLKFE